MTLHSGAMSRRYRLIALFAAQRALEMLPALPRPLFSRPQFRMTLAQDGSCLEFDALRRTDATLRPERLLATPSNHRIEMVASCLGHEAQLHGEVEDLPAAVHTVARAHDYHGTVALPSVLLILDGTRPLRLPEGMTPAVLKVAIDPDRWSIPEHVFA